MLNLTPILLSLLALSDPCQATKERCASFFAGQRYTPVKETGSSCKELCEPHLAYWATLDANLALYYKSESPCVKAYEGVCAFKRMVDFTDNSGVAKCDCLSALVFMRVQVKGNAADGSRCDEQNFLDFLNGLKFNKTTVRGEETGFEVKVHQSPLTCQNHKGDSSHCACPKDAKLYTDTQQPSKLGQPMNKCTWDLEDHGDAPPFVSI
ncbi:hypothetical protein BCR37DRAFT_115186 [Protomyces lactucae-debilis]|uniref:Uncharacterized protein n=1 Tax=Protomyces lactucae-debilis TaxID=2754530 RepID=A0A1Y2F3V7_PROLT|nr:uncharacterized protein BCR37DRAFT_115186 [Protomyces lactucae-debilis]ORY78174.1 hypothetical protein BCR37DRAFT_115186 [Protomyces lactucae-debilis]